MAASDDVLDLAVAGLRDKEGVGPKYVQVGGRLPARSGTDDSAARAYLAAALEVRKPTDSTDLVEIVVHRAGAGEQGTGYEANAVAHAVKDKIALDADARITQLATELGDRTEKLSATSTELQKIREDYWTQVDRIAFVDKQAVSVIPAKQAYWIGGNPVVSGLLGAAGGTSSAPWSPSAAGAGRRRARSPRQLLALAPDLVVRTTAQSGELAGRLLETGRRTVVVLAMPQAAFPAAQLSMAVAHHVRTHGATVALVDRLSEQADGPKPEDRLWALRRDVRRDVPGNFSADVIVVGCPADEEALSLTAGQSDLLVVVVAKQRASTLTQLRRTVDAVRIIEPVVVLAS